MELRLVLLAHIVGICSGLRDVRLQIPTAVKNGDAAILNCWYDTEGDALYSVKWYKDAREFYRYTPKDNPPVKTFAIPSLKVNKSESNATQVAVTEVDLDSAGTYSCEVSADAPSFQTAIVMAAMNIVELPKRRPSIHGLKSKYRINDDLHGNCTSDWSKPAANLTWFVNDRQVISHGDERHTEDSNHPYGPDWLQPLQAHVRHYSPAEKDIHGQISKIGIRFRVTPQHFSSGKLKIRCSASIYDIYWQSTEVSAEEDRPRVIHFEPAATIVGINYLQPPPNFQTGQKKPDGQVGVKVIGSSSSMDLRPSLRFILESFVLLLLATR